MVREAISRDQQCRSELDEKKNITRRDESYEIGDQVMTRKMNGRKFDPTFGPETMTVTATEHGGLTCQGEDGSQ